MSFPRARPNFPPPPALDIAGARPIQGLARRSEIRRLGRAVDAAEISWTEGERDQCGVMLWLLHSMTLRRGLLGCAASCPDLLASVALDRG